MRIIEENRSKNRKGGLKAKYDKDLKVRRSILKRMPSGKAVDTNDTPVEVQRLEGNVAVVFDQQRE